MVLLVFSAMYIDGILKQAQRRAYEVKQRRLRPRVTLVEGWDRLPDKEDR